VNTPSHTPCEYHQYTGNACRVLQTEITVEAPVTLTVNGEAWLSFSCTPDQLEALALGFLYNEGIIHSLQTVEITRLCASGENVDVWLSHAAGKPATWRRTSGCGDGKTNADAAHTHIAPLQGGLTLSPHALNACMEHFLKSQRLHRVAGGVHSSALSDGQEIILQTEDIGRHNTLDKLAGQALLSRLDMSRLMLLTTGRISSDMLQKAARMQVSIVVSLNSTNYLAIQMAQRWNVTLIAHARKGRFNVYTHPERILLPHSEFTGNQPHDSDHD